MRIFLTLIAVSLCNIAEAQLGIKPIFKAGMRTYGSSKFLPYESESVSKVTWYTYSGAIYISKIHTAIEGTYRESGRYAFIKIPDFLIKKPKEPHPIRTTQLPMSGDTLNTLINFYPGWLSFSFNLLPNEWEKHQFFFGGSMIKRIGGLNIENYAVLSPWGLELHIKSDPDVSQKAILWKTEYIFMPYKYSLVSLRLNYAHFSKRPHGYYEFILAIGTYLDL